MIGYRKYVIALVRLLTHSVLTARTLITVSWDVGGLWHFTFEVSQEKTFHVPRNNDASDDFRK